MKKMRKGVISAILLLAAFGFLATITGTSVDYASAGAGKYCNEGATKYCWTSLPDWYCLTAQGGTHCVDPK